jgi:glucokinase
MNVVAGIDIGGTNTACGLVTEDGEVLSKDILPTRSFTDAESLVKAVSTSIRQQIKNNPESLLQGIGIGAPNANPYTGTVDYAPNLSWKGVVPLKKMFEEELKLPTFITNDAKAAALGEFRFGAARGLYDFLVITLGTGLGSGLFSNGQIVYGHDGFAGELGHVIVERNGRLCGCGRKGCLETYCSATGIVRTYQELNPNAPENIDSKEITRRALEGEDAACEAYRKTGEMLGFALANFTAISSPSTIILFGGLVKAGDLLLNPVRETFEANLLPIYKGKTAIKISELHESDAALLGAGSLLFEN